MYRGTVGMNRVSDLDSGGVGFKMLGLGIYYFDERVLVTPSPHGYSSDVIVTGHLCEAGWEPKSAHYHGALENEFQG